jgi:hypothetical protein
MKYDFIEIGTSNFDTLIQIATDTATGLSIEPIKHYLDCLPNKPGVKKLNIAVSRDNTDGFLDIYYVPEDVIIAKRLPTWLKGCNSIGEYHLQHKKLNVVDLVVKQSVLMVPIADIFIEHDVTELYYLKIDTEGSDADIMLHLYDYLVTQSTTKYPKRILFESNELSDPNKVELVKIKFVELGYKVSDTGTNLNTVLLFADTKIKNFRVQEVRIH